MTALRLAVVALFLAFLATVGFKSNVPTHYVLAYLAVIIAFLVAVTVFQNRYTDGVRATAQDAERLHRPNEVGLIAVCGYVQWGLGSVAVLGIGRAMSLSEVPNLWFLGGLALAIGAGALGRAIKSEMGAWASTRLRLRSVTHQSVEVVLLTDKSLSTQQIEATAEYSRDRSSNDQLRSEVLWKSEPRSGEPRSGEPRSGEPQHTEIAFRFAMPETFTRGLDVSQLTWDRHWHLRFDVSPKTKLNFNFKVPPPGGG